MGMYNLYEYVWNTWKAETIEEAIVKSCFDILKYTYIYICAVSYICTIERLFRKVWINCKIFCKYSKWKLKAYFILHF